MKRKNLYIVFAILFVTPLVALAAGLVPCSGVDPATGVPDCQMCYFVDLMQNVVGWLVMILSIVVALIFVSAGIKLVTSGGNPGEKQAAKSMMVNATIGFIIVLAAWLLIDYGMKALLAGGTGSTKIGPWNSIQCVDQPVSGINRIYQPVPNASRGLANTSALGSLTPAQIAALAAIGAPDAKVAAAGAAAGLDAKQIKNLQALMRVESGGCVNNISPVGALGCLQIMPKTARQYDSSLSGLSDAEVKAKLLDKDYNITLGTKIYANLNETYKGDEQRMFAAYNGGPGANAPSKDCPGQMRWQCEWDSPGCYGTSNTSCKKNTGYIETRNYVKKVADVAAKLP